ncbi:hypothetical protein FRUB_05909 [Fimbriiglobus ruber]|uniref:Uncharacterized protein n=1 Tax=Fimbriiglobus ruber TaxID=1908690 RepID=A0A225DPD6_9BACT|nr:hypothetical protein FRUB_05909 [Fimbriiglobus ruber]
MTAVPSLSARTHILAHAFSFHTKHGGRRKKRKKSPPGTLVLVVGSPNDCRGLSRRLSSGSPIRPHTRGTRTCRRFIDPPCSCRFSWPRQQQAFVAPTPRRATSLP